MGNNCKSEIVNNVLMSMSGRIGQVELQMLEKKLLEELVYVTVERMETLPAEVTIDIDERNRYIIELFLYKKKKLSDGTRRGYLYAIKRLLVQIHKPLTDINEMDIYYYLNWYESRNKALSGKKNQASTVNNERRFLSAFFTWMRREHFIVDNPVDGTEPLKMLKKPIDYFTEEEMARLKDGCQSLRDRAIIEVFRSTGARVGEIVGITRDMIDWTTGDVLILSEKSGRYRTLYLDMEARYHLRKYLDSRKDGGQELFTGEKAPYKGLSRCGIRYIMKLVAKNAGVTSRVYPHKMRKTLGMELKNKGIDIGSIQEIMGHADSRVTSLYYAQSTPDTLRNIRRQAA